jgi:DNA-binding winged helix-turn-helix (wHTH) protein
MKALDRYWSAHGILKAHRNWSYYYYVLLGLGRTYLEMGNTERAQIFFDLINDAISDLELNALKQLLERVSKSLVDTDQNRLVIDRERKVIVEPTLGEVHFERRFVLLEILYLLASQPGKVFTKEELVDKIWRESYNPMIHDSKVYTSISRLRKLIEPDFRRPIYILNERDGYAFNSAVLVEEVGNRNRRGPGSGDKKDSHPNLEGVGI